MWTEFHKSGAYSKLPGTVEEAKKKTGTDHENKFADEDKEVELCIEEQEEVFGMCGSGMLILNYPYGIDEMLSPVVDELYKALSRKGASARLKVLNPQE